MKLTVYHGQILGGGGGVFIHSFSVAPQKCKPSGADRRYSLPKGAKRRHCWQ